MTPGPSWFSFDSVFDLETVYHSIIDNRATMSSKLYLMSRRMRLMPSWPAKGFVVVYLLVFDDHTKKGLHLAVMSDGV